MKILFVLENYYPHIGGVEILFKNLAEGLAKKGHNITILTGKNFTYYKDEENINGVYVKRIKLPSFLQRYFFTFFAIFQTIKIAKNYDIIHTTTYNATLPAYIGAKLKHKKSIITIHEVWDKKWFKWSGNNILTAYILWMLEKCVLFLKFDIHVCVSNSTLNDYKKLYPKRNSCVVYNGIDYNEIDAINQQNKNDSIFIKTYNYNQNDFLIFSFGRPGISKGFDYLIDAIPDIIKKIPHAKFLFVWPDNPNFISLRKKFISKINSYNLKNDIIKIESAKKRYELFECIKYSNCVVIPSLSEGFGYAVAEACALHAKIVASNTTSIPEVISGKYLLSNPADTQSIVECIYKIYKGEYLETPIKKFEIEKMVAEYEKIYTEII